MLSDNKKIKLSIAIPTYNGARFIRQTLDSIVDQLNDADEEMEIVVSDNASTDKTPEIIKEYKGKHPFIKYFRNDENLGFDKNVDLLFKRAKGEYVWLFSDDDIIVQGGIKKVLEVIKKNPEVALIFVNWSNYSQDLKHCNVERAVEIHEDILFLRADDFLFTIKLNPILISSNVISRKLWEESFPEIYVGTNWIHYGVILNIILKHFSYYIAKPYVIYRSGNIRWDKEGAIGLLNSISLMRILSGFLRKGYYKKSASESAKIIMRSLPRDIKILKKKRISFQDFHTKTIISQFKSYPFFWVVIIPLLLLPSDFYILISKTKKFFSRAKLLMIDKISKNRKSLKFF
ncbi:MAG TPA: glycosyltransferase [bacterium]|nr:glycosyltransferase [bacterium]